MGEDRTVEPTIYDVAAAAGVSPSTVSRALSKPGRVSFKTAEHVRRIAEEMGYRSGRMVLPVSSRGTGVLALIVADIANPVFVGMIRGAEREAAQHGVTLAIVETQESEQGEQQAISRLEATVDGFILASSRMSDRSVRSLAKRKPLVLLNRTVGEVASVVSDNVQAIKKATEHLVGLNHRSICYLSGPDASYANGMRWRGLKEAALELDLQVRRLGPFSPTMRGGAEAAALWRDRPTPAVIAYNDLMALGFMNAVTANRRVPRDVSVIGFDNIPDGDLVTPGLTTIAAPLVSIGSTAVAHLLTRAERRSGADEPEPVLLPARLIIRGSTGQRK